MKQCKRGLSILVLFIMMLSIVSVDAASSLQAHDAKTESFESYTLGTYANTGDNGTDTSTFDAQLSTNQSEIWNGSGAYGNTSFKVESETVDGQTNKFVTLTAEGSSSSVLLVGKQSLLNEEGKTLLQYRFKSSLLQGEGKVQMVLRDLNVGPSSDTLLFHIQAEGIYLLGSIGVGIVADTWYDCTAIIDAQNGTIEVKAGTKTGTLTNQTINATTVPVFRLYNATSANGVSIDDVSVADSYYDYTINEDFESLSSGVVSSLPSGLLIGAGQISVDTEEDNTFLKIAGGTGDNSQAFIYTYDSLFTEEKLVLEFDMRLAPTTEDFYVYIRKSSSEQVPLLYYTNGTLKLMTVESSVDIKTDEFVNFRYVITQDGTNPTEYAVFANGEWLATVANATDISGTPQFRFQCNPFATSTNPENNVGYLDNLKLYVPPVAQLKAVNPTKGATGIGNVPYITLKYNNAMNASTLKKENFLLNDSSNGIKNITWDAENIYVHLTSLSQNTAYSLKTKDKSVKDLFDQSIDFETTFTTGSCSSTLNLFNGTEPITEMIAGTVNAKATFAVEGNAWNGKAIMAHYDGDGKLQSCRICDTDTITDGMIFSQDFETTEQSEIRFYVWNNMNDLTPVLPMLSTKTTEN